MPLAQGLVASRSRFALPLALALAFARSALIAAGTPHHGTAGVTDASVQGIYTLVGERFRWGKVRHASPPP